MTWVSYSCFCSPTMIILEKGFMGLISGMRGHWHEKRRISKHLIYSCNSSIIISIENDG